MIDLQQLSKDIHKNAVEHGFWEELDIETKFALMHSELGEAMEEFQHGRPMVWYACPTTGRCCHMDNEHCGAWQHGKCVDRYAGNEPKKPEGIAVELIDCCIRILDFMGYADIIVEGGHRKEKYSLSELVNRLHYHIVLGMYDYMQELTDDASGQLSFAVNMICNWIDAQGVDSHELMLQKHEYNKTRPYLHGKKC